MDAVLSQLIKIFEPKNVDWMGYKVTKQNPYTYHHIKEKRKGGKATIDNGAILSRQAHDHLNYLELYVPDAYNDWQNLFRYFNALKRPLTEKEHELIEKISYYETLYEERKYPRKINKKTKLKQKGKRKWK